MPCDLHKAELAQRKDVVARTVIGHHLTHMVIEGLPMFRLVHVYEVNHDYSAHVPESELAGYFVGSPEVHLKRIGLLVVGCLGTVA